MNPDSEKEKTGTVDDIEESRPEIANEQSVAEEGTDRKEPEIGEEKQRERLESQANSLKELSDLAKKVQTLLDELSPSDEKEIVSISTGASETKDELIHTHQELIGQADTLAATVRPLLNGLYEKINTNLGPLAGETEANPFELVSETKTVLKEVESGARRIIELKRLIEIAAAKIRAKVFEESGVRSRQEINEKIMQSYRDYRFPRALDRSHGLGGMVADYRKRNDERRDNKIFNQKIEEERARLERAEHDLVALSHPIRLNIFGAIITELDPVFTSCDGVIRNEIAEVSKHLDPSEPNPEEAEIISPEILRSCLNDYLNLNGIKIDQLPEPLQSQTRERIFQIVWHESGTEQIDHRFHILIEQLRGGVEPPEHKKVIDSLSWERRDLLDLPAALEQIARIAERVEMAQWLKKYEERMDEIYNSGRHYRGVRSQGDLISFDIAFEKLMRIDRDTWQAACQNQAFRKRVGEEKMAYLEQTLEQAICRSVIERPLRDHALGNALFLMRFESPEAISVSILNAFCEPGPSGSYDLISTFDHVKETPLLVFATGLSPEAINALKEEDFDEISQIIALIRENPEKFGKKYVSEGANAETLVYKLIEEKLVATCEKLLARNNPKYDSLVMRCLEKIYYNNIGGCLEQADRLMVDRPREFAQMALQSSRPEALDFLLDNFSRLDPKFVLEIKKNLEVLVNPIVTDRIKDDQYIGLAEIFGRKVEEVKKLPAFLRALGNNRDDTYIGSHIREIIDLAQIDGAIDFIASLAKEGNFALCRTSSLEAITILARSPEKTLREIRSIRTLLGSKSDISNSYQYQILNLNDADFREHIRYVDERVMVTPGVLSNPYACLASSAKDIKFVSWLESQWRDGKDLPDEFYLGVFYMSGNFVTNRGPYGERMPSDDEVAIFKDLYKKLVTETDSDVAGEVLKSMQPYLEKILAMTQDRRDEYIDIAGQIASSSIPGVAEMKGKLLKKIFNCDNEQELQKIGRAFKTSTEIFGDFLSPELYSAVLGLINGQTDESLIKIGVKDVGESGLNQLREIILRFRTEMISPDFDVRILLDSPILAACFKSATRYENSQWGDHGETEFRFAIENFSKQPREQIEVPDGYLPSGEIRISKISKKQRDGFEYSEPFINRFHFFQKIIAESIKMEAEHKPFSSLVDRAEEIRVQLLADLTEKLDGLEKPQAREGLSRRIKMLESIQLRSLSEINKNFVALSQFKEFEEFLLQIIFIYSLHRSSVNNPDYASRIKELALKLDPDFDDISLMIDFVGHVTNQETWSKYFTDKKTREALYQLTNIRSLEEELSRAQGQQTRGTTSFEIIPTRGILMEFSGHIADACWASKYQSISAQFPNFTTLVFVQNRGNKKERIAGACMLIETESADGQPLLVVRGLNPIENFINSVYVEDFMTSLTDYVKKIAESNNRQAAIVGGRSGGATTNRPVIAAYLSGARSSMKNIPLASSEDTTFNGYNIVNSVFLL